MRPALVFALLLAATLWAAGCSKVEPPKADEKKADEKKAEPPPKKYVLHPVEPGRLKALLPEAFPELEREAPTSGYTLSDGNKISNAKVFFKKGDKEAEIAVLDFAQSKNKIELGYWWTTQTVDHKLSDGYEKSGYVMNLYKTYEKLDVNKNASQYMVHCGERFIVSGTGVNVTMEALKEAVNKVDIRKLAAMKGPAQAPPEEEGPAPAEKGTPGIKKDAAPVTKAEEKK